MDERVVIVDAEMGHIPVMAAVLRDADIRAIAHTGMEPAEVIRRCFRTSVMRRTAYVDGDMAAMWGCAGALLGGVGEAWLFTGAAVERVPRAVLRTARDELASFRAAFREMRGIVLGEDRRACRFAERLGCRMVGELGPFLRYEVI